MENTLQNPQVCQILITAYLLCTTVKILEEIALDENDYLGGKGAKPSFAQATQLFPISIAKTVPMLSFENFEKNLQDSATLVICQQC